VKAFFEEYGFVIVTLVVVFFLIIIATALGTNGGVIQNALNGWMEKLGNSVNAVGTGS